MPKLPLVDIENASRSFVAGDATTIALTPVTCRVLKGDSIALVGRSGSGKSTLLHLMAGLDLPSGGRVSWPALGSIETLRPRLIGVAYQMQSLVPWLTVVENVALPLQLLDEGEETLGKARAALQRFCLEHLSEKLPEELSGGQAQRVSLARAMVPEPQLVLADEPTGQLDHTTAAHIMDALLGWATEAGTTIVVATHDESVAARFNENWHMQHGTLIRGGTTS